jgi:hypothetical protein
MVLGTFGALGLVGLPLSRGAGGTLLFSMEVSASTSALSRISDSGSRCLSGELGSPSGCGGWVIFADLGRAVRGDLLGRVAGIAPLAGDGEFLSRTLRARRLEDRGVCGVSFSGLPAMAFSEFSKPGAAVLAALLALADDRKSFNTSARSPSRLENRSGPESNEGLLVSRDSVVERRHSVCKPGDPWTVIGRSSSPLSSCIDSVTITFTALAVTASVSGTAVPSSSLVVNRTPPTSTSGLPSHSSCSVSSRGTLRPGILPAEHT